MRTLLRPVPLAALAVVAALLAWFLTPNLVGQEQFDGIPIAQEGEPQVDPSEEAAADEAITALPVETFQVFLSRDPFEPVIPEAVPTEGGGGEPGTNPTEGPGGPGGTDELCDAGSNSATCEGLTVTLLDVTSDANGTRIIVQVGDTLYEVTVGSIFAGSFQVLAITPPCADLLYGDDTFTLCQGDRVLK